MDRVILKAYHKIQRKKRVRKKISGSATVPRISVYKSSKNLCLQAINDCEGLTIASASTHGNIEIKKDNRGNQAQFVGAQLSKCLLEKNIAQAVFDCNGNRYHGIVKTIAESIRANGIQM